MVKRLFDVSFAALVLVAASPVLAWALWRVRAFDGQDPIYRATRVGRGNRDFTMLKIRTMSVGADKLGGASTSARDTRITPVGHLLRRYKLDELLQFWNVLKGDMSVVGPRPQIRAGGVDQYTSQELQLLSVQPGITDISSIVFADEGQILESHDDPDAAYNFLIRPGKSRLGLFYVLHRTFRMDLELIYLTAVAVVSRSAALAAVARMLRRYGAKQELVNLALRKEPLERFSHSLVIDEGR